MGVEFLVCANCTEIFADCGEYYWCEGCSNNFCSSDCAAPKPIEDSDDEDLRNCCICRKEEANNYILLHALLRHYKITREDAMKIWQEEKDNGE